ncbi:hypothetical protein FKM82_018216 [Ascaphus truei]
MKTSARREEFGRPLKGTRCVCLEKRSMTTRIVSFPLESGSSTMKSIEIWFQGRSGIGKGRRRPAGLTRGTLLRAQVPHALTNSSTSLALSGHQKVR